MAIPLPSDPRKYTAPLERAVLDLNRQFPDVASMGIYNRRPIAGTSTWSQHSWGNAVDITSPVSVARMKNGPLAGQVIRDTRNPEHMAYLDRVNRWLDGNRYRLGIRVKLWRTTSHWNHIHIDMYPRQYGTPPDLTGSPVTGDDMAFAAYLKEVQISLNDAGYVGANGQPLSVDGVLGDNTIFAMKARDLDAAEGNARVLLDKARIPVLVDVDFVVDEDGELTLSKTTAPVVQRVEVQR